MKYWFTENDPHVSRLNHGVWAKTGVNEARQLFGSVMKPDDLVFIYETRYNRDHSISDGRSKIVALTSVETMPFARDAWVKVADTSWLADLDCPEVDAHEIVGKKSFRKIGRGGLNVMELSRTAAFLLLGYCRSDADYRRLATVYFADEVNDSEEQRRVERAQPTPRQEGPRRPTFVQTAGGRRVRTDPGIAKARLELASYRCEIDSSHASFRSAVTKKNYVEAHHLIPLSAQDDFEDAALDHEANVFALCPNCHRLLHHSVFADKKSLLTRLLRDRAADLDSAGISLPLVQLWSYYK